MKLSSVIYSSKFLYLAQNWGIACSVSKGITSIFFGPKHDFIYISQILVIFLGFLFLCFQLQLMLYNLGDVLFFVGYLFSKE